MAYQQQHGIYTLSDDPALLDGDAIYGYLSQSYWANTRSRYTQDRANAHSLCMGVYGPATAQGRASQVGFARLVTDYATFAYLADVYVLPAQQGQGLGKALAAAMLAHPEVQGLRRWALATRDAHGLYAQQGWLPLAHTERWMERFDATANAVPPP